MNSVISVSDSVGSRRWPISCDTGCAEKIELPRSPRTSCPIQVKNWISSGWSSPSLARIFATSSACGEIAGDDRGRIARREVQQREDEHRDDHDDRHGRQQAADQEDMHDDARPRGRSRTGAVAAGFAAERAGPTSSPSHAAWRRGRRLLLLDVPQHQPRRVQDAGEALAMGDRREELAGRNVRHDFVEALLQPLDDFLLLVGRRERELEADLLELLVARPAEPVLAVARRSASACSTAGCSSRGRRPTCGRCSTRRDSCPADP